LIRIKLAIKEVPCKGCTLCCQGDAIRLEPEDRAIDYKTEPHLYIPGALMLAHKANGECIYLDERGCSIHDRAPSLCRTADCRNLAARIDFETARKLHLIGKLDIRVWDQGHRLLEAMSTRSD
jgi:Fe-S-cluster containining protein